MFGAFTFRLVLGVPWVEIEYFPVFVGGEDSVTAVVQILSNGIHE